MISLRDKIVNEGILGSTNSGKARLKKQVEEWIEDNNIKDATINPDCSVTIGGNVRFGKNVIKGAIPDYIVLNSVQDLTITETDSLKNMPKNAVVLTITNSSIDNFEDVNMDYCESFRVFNCDIKSLKGLPKDCNSLYIGNNKQHFTKKEIKKFVNTKPNYIYTLGYYSLKFYDLLTPYGLSNYPLIVLAPAICIVISYVSKFIEKFSVGKTVLKALGFVGSHTLELYITHFMVLNWGRNIIEKYNITNTDAVWFTSFVPIVLFSVILCYTGKGVLRLADKIKLKRENVGSI